MMSDPLTVRIWPWILILVALLALFLWLADRYDRTTLPRVRANLDSQRPTLLGAELDATVPPCRCDACRADDLVADIEAWLRARDTYEGRLG